MITNLDELINLYLQKCNFLTKEEIYFYLENGYLIKEDFIPEKVCDDLVNDAKHILKKNNIDLNNPSTFKYECIRTNFVTSLPEFRSTSKQISIKNTTSKIWNFNQELTLSRLNNHNKNYNFDNQVIVGLKKNNKIKEPILKKDMMGWHKDGIEYHYFDHNLSFICLYALSDILDGGTGLAIGSQHEFGKFLYEYKKGVLFDHVVETGFLTPYIIEKSYKLLKLKYKKGDYIIMHPFMFHRICYNNNILPKFLINGAIFTDNINLNRNDNSYNLHELSLLYILNKYNLENNYERLDNKNRNDFFGAITTRSYEKRKIMYNKEKYFYKYCYDNNIISDIKYLNLSYCTNNFKEFNNEKELDKENLKILKNYINYKKEFL
jgi:hypothetical protein